MFGEEIKDFEVVEVLPFNSTRKRMSFLVRKKEGLFMLTKGADDVLYELLS